MTQPLEFEIVRAELKSIEGDYVGSIIFTVVGHAAPYQLSLLSSNTRDWDYSLTFAGEPSAAGTDEQIEAVEHAIETDDELFDYFIDQILSKL